MADAATLAELKFGIGQPVDRMEDPRLSRGRYADGIRVPGGRPSAGSRTIGLAPPRGANGQKEPARAGVGQA